MSDLKSAIYGFIIGDCLGVPFEFKKRGSFHCTDMVGHGTHNQPAGTWSDDTSMMLATLDSLKQSEGRVDVEDMRKRFKDWIYSGKYTADGKVFDYGITTKQALDLGVGLNDFYSNGNGSLMRILPLAFSDCTNDEIDKVSEITHAHPISKEACRIYVKIARFLIVNKNLKGILENLECTENFSKLKYLNILREEQIKSSGYVVDTLEASLWCVLMTNSYKNAVLKAVNLGDDTDTIGAITGGLAGVLYGYNNIPETWLEKLRNKDKIMEYINY